MLSVRGVYRGLSELGKPFSKHIETMDIGFTLARFNKIL